VVSVTALRDAQDVIIGYLLIGTELKPGRCKAPYLIAQLLEHRHRREGRHSNIQRRRGANARLTSGRSDEKITPADISDPRELIARCQSLSAELRNPDHAGFEALWSSRRGADRDSTN